MELKSVRLTDSAPLVFIAEDDKDILELVVINLEQAGYRTAYALSGWLAWEAIKGHPPDAVLLDIDLPGMDGFAVLRAIRARRETKSTPVIMMTAHGAPDDVGKAIQMGATDFVTKPFENHILLQRVARATHWKKPPVLASTGHDGALFI